MSEERAENIYEFFISAYQGIASPSQLWEWEKKAADPLMSNLEVREKIMQRMMNNLKELKKNKKSKENDFKITHQEELLEKSYIECSKVIDEIRDRDGMTNTNAQEAGKNV